MHDDSAVMMERCPKCGGSAVNEGRIPVLPHGDMSRQQICLSCGHDESSIVEEVCDEPHDKKALRRAKRGRLDRLTLEMSTFAMGMPATRAAAGVMAIADSLRFRLVPLRPGASAGVYVAVPGAR